MKFTNGAWFMRKNVKPFYPALAYDAEKDKTSLIVLGTAPIANRGATLGGPTLTVRFSSPMPDVIRVQAHHFKGGADAKPAFELNAKDSPDVKVSISDVSASIQSGRLTARISRKAWSIDFIADGRIVTSSGARGMALMETEPDGPFMQEQLNVGAGECVYGLGERFTAFVKNGQAVDIWNDDGGTCSELTYKNIPFYMTNRGYGVFVNHPGRVSFEACSETVSRVQFSVPGQQLEYFMIYGPSPKEVLEKYTRLTGRPALPPAWSFGLWLTTSFVTDYDEKTVSKFIQGMSDRKLPLHVFHFDCFWMKEFQWCDFKWDSRMFPDPAGMLKRLKKNGLRICVWINPYIAQRSHLFDEGKAHGYLVKKPDGGVWQRDEWQAGMGLVDFTNPDACKWFASKLRALLDMGVDCFKTDFGERIPTDVVYHDGSDPVRMHNYYTYLYNRTVFGVLTEKRGKGEAAVFARSATVGGQKFPVHWGGDSTATYPSMAETLRGGLSLGLGGFGFWSHDIGGFGDTASPDLYKRWVAFGLLSSHSRLHGNTSYRVPWLFDEESVDVLRFFTNLKCRLMPYLFAGAVEAHETGVPLLRAMMLEFPNDPACDHLDRQYMLGGSLLVAPVFSEDGEVDYYVPAGRWTNIITGDVVEGPRWHHEKHGYLSLPLLARPGSVIPFGCEDSRPDYDYADGAVFYVYELAEGQASSARVHTQKGDLDTTVRVSRKNNCVTVEKTGKSPSEWQVLLVNERKVKSVDGGKADQTEQGMLITPKKGGRKVRIHLQ